MYYLQSRYYNPEWGRFINADAILIENNELKGNNMYIYCENNPINGYDLAGYKYIHQLLVGFGHPFKAIGAYFELDYFHDIQLKYYPNTANKNDGSQSNAFKHINMAAQLTYSSGESFARKLTKAHEKDVPNPKEHTEMDLRNNEIGIEIGNLVKNGKRNYKNLQKKLQTQDVTPIVLKIEVTYLGKDFDCFPYDAKNLIEEISFYAVQSGEAIVVNPDAGN